MNAFDESSFIFSCGLHIPFPFDSVYIWFSGSGWSSSLDIVVINNLLVRKKFAY